MSSNLRFSYLKCCAHAVGKISVNVTETLSDTSNSSAAPMLLNAHDGTWSSYWQLPFSDFEIIVTFCDKDRPAQSFVHCMNTTIQITRPKV